MICDTNSLKSLHWYCHTDILSPARAELAARSATPASNECVDHDVLEGVVGLGMKLVLVTHDLVVVVGLTLFRR